MGPGHPRRWWSISGEAPIGLCNGVSMVPEACYAGRDHLQVVYAVISDGPIDVTFVSGFVSNFNRTLDPEQWAAGVTA